MGVLLLVDEKCDGGAEIDVTVKGEREAVGGDGGAEVYPPDHNWRQDTTTPAKSLPSLPRSLAPLRNRAHLRDVLGFPGSH